MARSSQQAPAELAALAAAGGDVRALTSRTQRARLAQLDLPKAEHFTFAGAGGTSVHGMLLKPPAFDASKKYPVLMVLHGGPETQFGDTWSFRWNTQTLASPGYAVLMINRRGSTGFGQQFTDDINNDWGGKAYEDLMKGLDAALAKYAVPRRHARGGGRRVVRRLHDRLDGVAIEGPLQDAGVPRRRLRPGQHVRRHRGSVVPGVVVQRHAVGQPRRLPAPVARTAKAADFGTFKTPTLVIHGELDFRVPYTQGLEFYTALQRQGVPSRLVVFPDEGHWILKPQNSAFWYHEVQAWLKKYL